MQKNQINEDYVSSKLLQYQEAEKKENNRRRSSQNTEIPSLWFSKRLLVSVTLFLCFVNFQMLRNNMNITVVEMTANRTSVEGNVTVERPPEFIWDTSTIGLTMSALSYGGLLSFLGEFLVKWFGGSGTCSLCMLVSGILTILHPAILYIDLRLFLACRFITGLFEIFFYVSTAEVFSRWIPKQERSTLISFSFNGTNVGHAIAYPICGYLAHKWGWQVVFYVTGIVSILVSLIFVIVVKNDPSQDKWISKKERLYIMQATDHETRSKNNSHPYKDILTSAPMWALCTIVFTYMWVASILGACLPLYINDLTDKETDEIGILSSIPNVIYIFMFPICGIFMDFWKDNSNTTLTRIHKVIMSIAFGIASGLFVAAALSSSFFVSMILFVLIQIAMSFAPLICQIVGISLAPDHSSVIAGLTTFCFSASSVVAQTLTGFMIRNHTLQEWNNCFYLAAGVSTFGASLFLIYGSSEAQPWSAMAIKEECILDELDEKI